ncbi:MAG: sulfatase [Candidatus Euphemobacter frigidus]|nr:sulfatase [Candidatus Euphemobacter frigidus]
MKKRVLIVFLAIIVVGVGGLVFLRPFWKKDRPNIIFLLLDALRADHLGCYGYNQGTSPVIDAVAAEGALFQNHFANGTYTLSSVPTYFYSRYFIKSLFPADRRIPLQTPGNLFRKLDDEAVSIASVFKKNGYRTAIFSAHPWFIRGYELMKDFDDFYRVSERRSAHGSARKIFARMTAWIEEKGVGEEPFFIYAHLMDTHFPHERKKESEEYIQSEADFSQRFDWRGYPRSQTIGAGGLWRLPPDFPEEDRQYLNAIYDGDVKYTDTQLGDFIRFLKEEGLYDDTLLVITADHGEHLGEHNLTEHGGPPWDSVISIPLIMRLPGKIDPGGRMVELTENVDILPTMVSLLGLKVPAGKKFDGRDFLRRKGPGETAREYVLTANSIRTPRFKYMIDTADDSEFLYDLQTDPGEENNLIEREPSRAEELKKTMNNLLSVSRARYEDAISKESPELPFAISADYFDLASESPIKVVKRYYYPAGQSEFLSKVQQSPYWIHNKIAGRYYILGFNQPGLSPLSIKFPVPNGRYRVTVACLVGKVVRGYPMSIFRMSLGRDDPARSVLVDASNAEKKEQFDLGEILVEDKQFRVFLYPVTEPSWSSLLYFGFEPVLPGKKLESADDIQNQKRLDKLKSLGYVR